MVFAGSPAGRDHRSVIIGLAVAVLLVSVLFAPCPAVARDASAFADLAAEIRAVVGPGVPIVAAFDLHGNISAECVALYDFMCPVHLYPHTDTFERGQECMRMVPRLLGGAFYL